MRKTLRLTSLSLSIVVVFSLASCSSSSSPATDGEMMSAGTGTLSLEQDRSALVEALAGYLLEDRTEDVLELGETLVAEATAGVELGAGSFSVDGRAETVVTPTNRVQYNCPLGGTVVTDIGIADLGETNYANYSTHTQYEFDQCRTETQGEQLLSGTIRILDQDVSASGGEFDNKTVQWSGFSWQVGGNSNLEGTALIEIRRTLTNDTVEARVVTIDQFEVFENTQRVLTIMQGSMTLNTGIEGSGVIESLLFNTQGTVTNATGVPVQVSTPLPLTARLVTSLEFSNVAEAFAGTLELSADDGSSLTLTAQPILEKGPLLMDSSYVGANGAVNQQTGVEFYAPTVLY